MFTTGALSNQAPLIFIGCVLAFGSFGLSFAPKAIAEQNQTLRLKLSQAVWLMFGMLAFLIAAGALVYVGRNAVSHDFRVAFMIIMALLTIVGFMRVFIEG